MHLGVDLGTTRTIVALADRGNYPVVSFLDEDGDAHENFPSVVAAEDGELVHGFEALAAARRGAPLLRSFKRALADPDVGAGTLLTVGDLEVPLLDLLTGYLSAVRTALRTRSNLSDAVDAVALDDGVPLRAVVAVPAHAHGAQRFLTLEAFRRAGFEVLALVNEPSAAGFEYTHHRGGTISSRRTRVVVYDLGGGTFDASLVDVEGHRHAVLGSNGLNRLGGDDFDEVLARCVLETAAPGAAAARSLEDLGRLERDDLLDRCREAKERIAPQSRRVVVEVGDTDVSVPVDTFYARATPLVEATVEAMRPLLGGLDDAAGLTDVAGIYLVGGASGLPLVPRLLRERFGRRVHRSPHPSASTAIGLAIAADDEAGFTLSDRLSRGFGVFRERSGGAAVSFDPILGADTALPEREGVVAVRRYRAAHNLGWYRFVECAGIDDDGEPRGDVVPFADVLFPFDPALRDGRDLRDVTVERREGCLVEERYLVDANGMVEVQITDLDTRYTQRHAIGTSASRRAWAAARPWSRRG
ncbi:chaperone protein HscA [Georgenia soli]|uniref:Chaperone protein HscA n=1 Tax=Georgenia soli TaxID=638953 RepID=A0A2A9ER51_9MICO|nr:Hsp70 family protein [Georgenia soli]PFG40730.1 chaperone protein HscA [Georgenia soli]